VIPVEMAPFLVGGDSEDAPLLEAHRPSDPILAKVFDEAAQALRQLPPD
jgi:hypothetical protein